MYWQRLNKTINFKVTKLFITSLSAVYIAGDDYVRVLAEASTDEKAVTEFEGKARNNFPEVWLWFQQNVG